MCSIASFYKMHINLNWFMLKHENMAKLHSYQPVHVIHFRHSLVSISFRRFVLEKKVKEATWPLPSTVTRDSGWGEQAQDLLQALLKAYSINIDTHASCLAASPDWASFGHCTVPCLSWVQPEDRMAAASTCSANVTCLSAMAAHRHTLTVAI